MSEAHVSPRAVHLTALSLLVLWAVSWALSYVALGAMSLPLALGIAVLKALLVLFFFMELKVERFSIRATVLSAIALIAVFMTLTVADVETRGQELRPPRVDRAP